VKGRFGLHRRHFKYFPDPAFIDDELGKPHLLVYTIPKTMLEKLSFQVKHLI